MKKNEVKVGGVYIAKVSGNIVPVKIDRENPRGGWDATNLKTKKSVRIKSAQRLRRKASGFPARRIVTKAQYEAEAKREADVAGASSKKSGGGITEANKADAVNAAMLAVEADKKKRAKKPAKATQDAKPATKRDTGERGATGAKRPSGLDAAAQVLADADEPLNVKEIVALMLGRKLWQTSGKTPSATIYAAMTREIAAKGNAARFRKVDRGKFTLAK